VSERWQWQFLGDRAQGGSVATGDDTGEEVDVSRQLHAPKFFDIRVGACRFMGGDGLDLPLAQKPTLSIDLLSGQDMPLV
jgi:hypothetical protein